MSNPMLSRLLFRNKETVLYEGGYGLWKSLKYSEKYSHTVSAAMSFFNAIVSLSKPQQILMGWASC